MSREEFAGIIAYLAAAVNKPVPREQAEVYFDLLGDLPFALVQAAARRALLESAYPTLPPVGTLRRLATVALSGPDYPPAAEAYRMVLRVVNAPAKLQRDWLNDLPRPVRQAALAMGLDSIGDSTEPEVCRAQFTRCYEAYVSRSERESLLPAPLREVCSLIGQMPARLTADES